MTLLNAIKAFVNPPSESESGETSSDERQANQTPSNESNSEQALAVSDKQNQPDTTDSSGGELDTTDSSDTTDAPSPGGVAEGTMNQYRVVPTTSNSMSGYEIEQLGHPFLPNGDIDDEEEMYMGSWPRSMVETKLSRPKDPTWFGYVDDKIKGVDSAPIEFEKLFQHITIFGETGSGKSTLLMNLMTQWMFAGYGFCFIDPKGGGDARELVQRIPDHRKDDLIWIEPGSRRDYSVGFNLLETDSNPGDPDFNNEVQDVVEQFSNVIKNTSSGEGAVIDEVVEEVTRFLVKQDYHYNVLDLYIILFDESDRQQLPQDVTDQFDKKALQSIADKDDEDLNSIKRRVRPWVTDETTREILDVRDSALNIKEAINNNKIMIVDVGSLQSKDVLQMFVTALVRRMWSTIERREKSEEAKDPYFLIVDEFKKVAIDRLGIDTMMSEARSYNFSLTLATQQPSQLDNDILSDVFGNSKHVLTYKAGNADDNRKLAQKIGDMTAEEIGNLPEYTLAGTVMSRGKEVTIQAKAFPPYPPLHTPEEAEAIIEQSLHRYGRKTESKNWEDTDFSNYGVRSKDDKAESESEKIQINKDNAITAPEFLRLIFTAQTKYSTRSFDGEDGYVSKEDIRKIVEERYGEFASSTKLSQLLTEELDSEWRKNKMDGGVYTKLSDAGEAVAFEQDSGEGGSGGKDKHRHVLSVAWREFTKLGYDMDIPNQDEWGEEPPDGLATPPIQPVKESNNSAEFYQLESLLQSEYPRLYELFGDLTVAVEAETTTQTKPAQTIKNLSKAVKRNQKCAFVAIEKVPDSEDEDDEPYQNQTPLEAMDKAGGKIHDILSNPPFVSGLDGQNRHFYNTGNTIELRDGSRAVQKDPNGQTVWKEDGNKLTLRNSSDDEVVTTLRNVADVEKNPSRQKFDYYYSRDERRDVTVVYDTKKDDIIAEYDNVTQMKADGWRPIVAPCIPELWFDINDEDKRYPEEDAWQIFVVPRAVNPDFDSETIYLYKPHEPNMEDRFEPLVSTSQAEEEEQAAENSVTMPTIGSGGESEDKPTADNQDKPTSDESSKSDSSSQQQDESPTEDSTDEREVEQEDEKPSTKPSSSEKPTSDKPSEKPTSKPSENKPNEQEQETTETEGDTDDDDAWSAYRSPDDETQSKPAEAEKPTSSKPTASKPSESSSETEDPEKTDENPTEDSVDDAPTPPSEGADEEQSAETDEDTAEDEDEEDEDIDDEEVWGDYKSSSLDL